MFEENFKEFMESSRAEIYEMKKYLNQFYNRLDHSREDERTRAENTDDYRRLTADWIPNNGKLPNDKTSVPVALQD
jgi:hypothetical protein